MLNLEHHQELLSSVGVETKEQIEKIGSLEIYRKLNLNGKIVDFEIVYRLEGALMNVDWFEIPDLIVSNIKERKRKYSFEMSGNTAFL